MIAVTGFFTREVVKAKVLGTSIGGGMKNSVLPIERLHALGLRGIERMNPLARHPQMPPDIMGNPKARPDLYVLGETPDEEEDSKGRPFGGRAGRLLRDAIPDHLNVRFNNCVNTLPIRRKGKLKPTLHELECFRPSVQADILATNPRIIVAVGDTAAHWCLGKEVGQISAIRGRLFPTQIKDKMFWVFVMHHPRYILSKLDDKGYEQIPGAEHSKFFQRDVDQICALVKKGLPKPKVEDSANVFDETVILKDLDKFEEWIDQMLEAPEGGSTLAIDLETNRTRPFRPGAKVLTIAFAMDGFPAIALPVDHPQAAWTKPQRKRLDELIRRLLESSLPKAAHNTPFDLEWMIWRWEYKLAFGGKWHCTQAQAYILDERKGALSLDFLNLLHFGLHLKKQSTGRIGKDWAGMRTEITTEIDRAKLEQTNVDDVCRYNAVDAKYTLKLYYRQKGLLKSEGLWETYRDFVGRVVSIPIAQIKGMPIDAETNRKFREGQEIALKEALQQIELDPSVKRYKKRYGEYNPNSYDHNVRMFRDFLHCREGQRGKSYSTDDEALSAMRVPLAKLVLKMRKAHKIKSTYLDKFDLANPKTLVYPDHRIHPSFKHTSTDTGRTSCKEPNAQNFPKRQNAWVRGMFTAPDRRVILTSDYGQIEARVIAMASKDKFLCKALWEDYDIHMEWAERIVRAYPQVCRNRHGSLDKDAMKKFRGEIKNQMVFPAFFGSLMESIARDLETPERIMRPIFDEFWDKFKDVLAWQKNTEAFYEEHGYVETLTGRRRHGPMNRNQLINAPIQGCASDMVINAWNRITRLAYETDRPWLYVNTNIHDDLTNFDVPIKRLDEAVELVVREMCDCPYDFVNVPIMVEIGSGKTWDKIKELGKFSSNKLDEQLKGFRRAQRSAAT